MSELALSLRLLFVTPDDRPPQQTLALIDAVLQGGVTAVLLRERRLSDDEGAGFCARAVALCRSHGALSLVSRDAELATRVAADGVHVGYGSSDVEATRQAAPGLLVGRSCHWPLEHDAHDADYVTLSPFGATPRSHPRPALSAAQIGAVVQDERLGPIVALGGLTAAQVPDLPDGLSGLAVMRALAGAADPRGAAAVLRSVADARWSLGVPG